MKLLRKLISETPGLEDEVEQIKLEAARKGYERGQLSKVSEKKQRRKWAKEAKKLAGKDINKFLDEFEGRFKRLQRLFWFSFIVNLILAFLYHVKA